MEVGRLVVLGPTYNRVDVRANVAAAPGWSPDEVVAGCRQCIAGFLHPLTGGRGGSGWSPGQRPHRSDILGLLDATDGVGLVQGVSLAVTATGTMPGIVAAGAIDVTPSEVA